MNINKIDNSSPIRVDLRTSVRGTEAERHVQRTHSPVAGEDEITLSGQASEVGALVERLKHMPDIREEKVDAIREKIAAGKFVPSDNDIADAIIRGESD